MASAAASTGLTYSDRDRQNSQRSQRRLHQSVFRGWVWESAALQAWLGSPPAWI